MASPASVTVSIAAESMGILSVMVWVSWELMLVSRGKTWLYAGISSTSSNVSPSPKNLLIIELLGEDFLVAMCKGRVAGLLFQMGPFYLQYRHGIPLLGEYE
jgi:hypothetical protein